jgi:ADP-ribose pyrophosphatase YjhB (NUDIX family)
VCNKCEFRIFLSPKPAVGLFVINEKKQILFLTRAFDPGKGKLGIPGGFINPNESLVDAIIRKTKEEIGLVINNPKYFDSFYGDYLYKGINYKTVDVFFTYRISESEIKDIKISDEESSNYKFYNVNEIKSENISTDDVKKAFTSLIQTMNY